MNNLWYTKVIHYATKFYNCREALPEITIHRGKTKNTSDLEMNNMGVFC